MFTADKEELLKGIDKLINPSVLVIGDMAIDEMVYGTTDRMSREAPVLILRHYKTKIILGAASNAANNIASLNCGKVSVIGTYGDDYYAPILLKTFEDAGINTSYMVKDESRATTVKVAIPKHDAVILSDYNIGLLTEKVIAKAIELAKKYNKIIVVDSQKDLDKFQGVTSMTPNQPDSEKFVGFFIKDKESLEKAGKEMLAKTNAESALITLGGDGMALFEKDGNFVKIPVFNKTDVFDVTGAGDTVVATYTLAMAAGLSKKNAAIISNLAASIVVRHFGCATTTIDVLKSTLKKLDFGGIDA